MWCNVIILRAHCATHTVYAIFWGGTYDMITVTVCVAVCCSVWRCISYYPTIVLSYHITITFTLLNPEKSAHCATHTVNVIISYYPPTVSWLFRIQNWNCYHIILPLPQCLGAPKEAEQSWLFRILKSLPLEAPHTVNVIISYQPPTVCLEVP